MGTDAAKSIDPYPDARYGHPGAVALPLIAALQRLGPRERAVVALAEGAGFEIAEIAAMLETSAASVRRELKRGRATLPIADLGVDQESERLLIDRFAAALEAIDRPRVAELLASDATLGCTKRWAVYRGRDRVAGILCDRMVSERLRLVSTRANGQPAFGCYVAEPRAASATARGLLAFSVAGGLVARLTRFWDNDVLPYFGLPDAVPALDGC